MEKQPSQKIIEIQISKEMNAPKWKIFSSLLRMNEFEKFMPNVKESKLIEVRGNTSLIKWHVDIEGIPIRWIERNTFNKTQHTLSFKALDGDLSLFEGKWHVSGNGQHSTLALTAKLETGIPLLERLIGGVLQEKVTRNFEAIFAVIERELREEFYRVKLPKGEIQGYALIGHPYNYQHMVRYLRSLNPGMKVPSREFLGKLFELTPPHKCYDIAPIVSPTGKKAIGHFIMCPIIPDMLALDLEAVFGKVVEACRVAERYGVGVVTLGGFTSIAGEQFGKEIQKLVSVPVTTGNTFTAALAVEGVLKGCELMGVDLVRSKLTVIGGSGDIGSACARVLAERVGHITLVARNVKRLLAEQGVLERSGKATVSVSSDINLSISDADVVISAASVSQSFLDASNFKSGAVICDIGYPKNIHYIVKERNDLLIFSGGLCSIPSPFDLGVDIDYGLPTKKILYGCFAEAALLDLEGRYEAFSYGKGNITKEKMDDIMQMAGRHGFKLAPFFWGDRLIGEGEFETIRSKVRR